VLSEVESWWKARPGRLLRIVLFLYGLSWVLTSTYIGFRLFPSVNDSFGQGDAEGTVRSTYEVSLLFWDFMISQFALVFLYVVVLGILGASVQILRAIAAHRPGPLKENETRSEGEEVWDSGYSAWYFALPFLGGTNALFIYLVIAAGFVGTIGAIDSFNIYGFSAIAIFAGLFSKKTFDKLADVFDVVFGVGEAGDNNSHSSQKSGDDSPMQGGQTREAQGEHGAHHEEVDRTRHDEQLTKG